MQEVPRPSLIRFGAFTADLVNGELRKHGIRVNLQQQPFKVLAALLERPDQLVTRDELRERLWPADIVVDFDRGLNKAVNRLREVLGDTADQPKFIETAPQRGYRFIGNVEQDRASVDEEAALPPVEAPFTPATNSRSLASRWIALGTVLAIALTAAAWRLTVPSKIESIAVLPLENLSGDPQQDFFSDAMTDELIGELAHISSLHIISRTSVLRYKKGSNRSLQQIAKELNADAVVEGTIASSGGKVRITAQLIRARDDRHLWSQKYVRDLTDILTLQAEVAHAIAWEVRASLRPEERNRLAKERRVNPDAYQAFLQGNYYLHQNIRGVQKSIGWFQRSIELDPGYADGHAGLAEAFIYAGIYEFRPFAEAYAEARIAAKRALELDETNAAAHNAMAEVKKGLDWDLEGADKEQRRALDLSPSRLLTRLWHAETLSRLERHEEALAESARAVSLDPVSPLSHNNRSMLLWRARRYDEAIRESQTALELDPSHVNALWWQGLAYAGKGDFTKSIGLLKKGFEMSKAPVFLGSLGYVFGLAGDKEKALGVIGQLKELAQKRYISPVDFAMAYAGLGDAGETFVWLEKAYEKRDGRVQQLVQPCFDSVRHDPRYQGLKARIGLR